MFNKINTTIKTVLTITLGIASIYIYSFGVTVLMLEQVESYNR